MNNFRINNKCFYLIVFCVVFVGAQFVSATEGFQNNLLKADLSRSSLDGVKLTLYTNKPYQDSVVVNKKSDFEYVILMPETSNSLTAKLNLSKVGDVVKSVDVKTQQYGHQIKGYTKITILTARPIEIASAVQALDASHYKLSEKDYGELLAQSAKNKATPAKKMVNNLAPQTKAKMPQAIKTMPPTKIASQAKPVQQLKKAAPVAKVIETVKTKKSDVVTPEAVTPIIATTPKQIQQSKPNVETASKPILMTTSNADKIQEYKKIIKKNIYIVFGLIIAIFILLLLMARKMTKNMHGHKQAFATHLEENPSSSVDYSEQINEDMTWKEKFKAYVDPSQALEESEPTQAQPSNNQDLDELFSGETQGEQFYTDELFTENFEGQESEEEIVEEVTQPSGIVESYQFVQSGIISEVAALSESSEEEEIQQEAEPITWPEEVSGYTQEDPMLDKSYGYIKDEGQPLAPEVESFKFQQYQSQPGIDNYAEDLKKEEISEEDVEDDFVKSEFVIDDIRGFYLVDFEDTTALVGHIEDEIFVLKRFDEKITETIQARLNERKPNYVNYMTKVGNFKALVEVTPENMNLLIEL